MQTTPIKQRVVRLVSIPKGSPAETLLRRGIGQQSIAEILAAVAATDVPFTAAEIIEDTFKPKPTYKTPFPIRRYGAGHFAVFYSSITEHTAEAEVRYHLSQMADWAANLPKHYTMLGCIFEGKIVDISECAIEFPDLVSETEDGYPFCQKLGDEFRKVADGILAPSARDQHTGRCIPIFNRATISQPTVMFYAYFIRQSEGVTLTRHA